MIAYLDATALVKRYLVERGSRESIALTAEAEMIATSIVSRAEVAAALAKAARIGLVKHDIARNAQRRFLKTGRTWYACRSRKHSWSELTRWLGSTDYAATMPSNWRQALTWQESVGEEIVVVTFVHLLWEASKRTRLEVGRSNFPVTYERFVL